METPSNLRRVTIKAMTDTGWITGTIFVPASVRLSDYMVRAPHFLSMSDVFMQAHSKGLPFFALQRNAVEFMAIDGNEDPASAEDTQIMEDHSISCLLSGGILKGNIAVKPGLRLSDYLAKHNEFVPIKECTYRVRVPQSREVAEEFCAFVLLNSEKVIGLSERSDTEDVVKEG
jgi:hypothetical protein